MKHIRPTSLQLPAKAQGCSDVTLFTPNKDLEEIDCNLDQLVSLVGRLKTLQLVFS